TSGSTATGRNRQTRVVYRFSRGKVNDFRPAAAILHRAASPGFLVQAGPSRPAKKKQNALRGNRTRHDGLREEWGPNLLLHRPTGSVGDSCRTGGSSDQLRFDFFDLLDVAEGVDADADQHFMAVGL